MSKINQIQNAILELDGGAFQKLADAYLLKKGYSVNSINSIGSVIKKNKTKTGTPDTLITLSNGKYVFAEYTTQESKVFKKFSDDIDKCLNTDKTGIATDKIEEVVLCYTSELLPTEIEQLRQQCEDVEINFNQYGMSTISYDLLEKYPQLAEEFLNISVDTGQIVELSSFIALYSKNKLATTLETNLYFREEYKRKTLDILNTNNLVIISGQAGVGKTRFAIECFKDFMSSNSSYKGYCIFNKSTDLHNDIQCYFSDSDSYLVFVDDANRLSNNFQYILQLLHVKRDNQYFKIIVTVRDYALEEIKKLCNPYEEKINNIEINLQSLENREIEKLLQEQFEINHHLYLEQITRIAHGNPRLAIMAAKIAKESNTFESIRDVSMLYDEYFSAIKHDLELLKDENILKIAGVISFFRSIDKNNEQLMLLIQEIFKISTSEFWEKSKILHNMEIFDIFENEVIKVSDQILGTYLIYLVFFKEKILSVNDIINEKIFPFFKQGIRDAIYPILNTFNRKKVEEILQPTIDKKWDYFYKNIPYNFVEFINIFWFLKPTETLIFVKEQIDRLSDKVESETNYSLLPPFISVLSNFAGADRNTLKMAIDLYLLYLEKQPQYVSKIKDIFIHSYGIQRDSYLLDYQIQFDVCEKILERCNSGHNEYFSKFFISLAEKHYLHTHFDCTKWEKKDTAILMQFNLLASPELFKFRELVWNSLFLFYKNNKNLQLDILNLILSYSKPSLYITENSIIDEDSKLISTFFKDNLDSTNLYHCIVVQQYLKSLKSYKIAQLDNLELFSSDNYKHYNFITDTSEKIELKLSSDKYHEYLKRKINKLFNSFTTDKYKQFIQELLNVAQLINDDSNKWRIEHSTDSILEELFERDSKLYVDVIRSCLEIKNFTKLNSIFLVKYLIEANGINRAFEIASNINDMWLFNYYKCLTRQNIQKKHIDGLLKLYSILDKQYFTYDMDHLLEYESVEDGFIIKVIQIIIDRAKREDISISKALYLSFHEKSKVYQQILKPLFSKHLELIKETYLTIDKNKDPHIDYQGAIFSEILDNDPNFIDDYLKDKFKSTNYLSKYDEIRDYSFLWRRNDYISIMKNIAGTIFKCENHHDYFELFFNKSVRPQTEDEIIKRQDKFLCEKITIEFCNKKYMRFLFDMIANFNYKRKVKFYHQFLKLNKNIDDFKNLIFEANGLSWSGSIIPLLYEKIDFYDLIMSNCDSIDFLKHREFIEDKIKKLREKIKEEQKRDFVEN